MQCNHLAAVGAAARSIPATPKRNGTASGIAVCGEPIRYGETSGAADSALRDTITRSRPCFVTSMTRTR